MFKNFQTVTMQTMKPINQKKIGNRDNSNEKSFTTYRMMFQYYWQLKRNCAHTRVTPPHTHTHTHTHICAGCSPPFHRPNTRISQTAIFLLMETCLECVFRLEGNPSISEYLSNRMHNYNQVSERGGTTWNLILDVSVTPVTVAKLRRASFGDMVLAIFYILNRTNIIKHVLYFMSAIKKINDDLHYNVLLSNYDQIFELTQ